MMEQPRKFSHLRRRARRGLALVMVICVMALAGILAYAMMSGSATQAVASSNGVAAAVAREQAESGVRLAVYYLLNPQNAPSVGAGGYWTGASNITFTTTASPSTTMPGSVSVTVTNPSTNLYNVQSIGSYSNSDMGTIAKTINAQVQSAYQINQAATFNTGTALSGPVTILSSSGSSTAVSANGAVAINSGAKVTGNLAATGYSLGGTGAFTGGAKTTPPASTPGPTAASVNHYLTYVYQGNTYSAAPLASATLSAAPTPNAASNPLNVYYYAGNLKITGSFNLNGTLVVQGGTLTLQSDTTTITPSSGMPGLIVDNAMIIKGASQTLTVNGVAYLGGGVSNSLTSATSIVNINGALLVDSGNIATGSAKLNITYNSSYAVAPNITSSNQTSMTVKLVSWSE